MKYILLIVFGVSIQVASAQINFDQLVYRGTGCPQGTVSSVVSPDGSTLSLLFDQFQAAVPQYDEQNDSDTLPPGRAPDRNSATLSHKNCALSFTATIPVGTRVDALEIALDARGAVILDQGVSGVFASILVGYNGLAQSRGRPTVIAQKHWRALRGPVEEEFAISPVAVVNLNSGCSNHQGRSIRFDLKNHVQAEISNGDTSRSGIITVDSADMKGMLKFRLRTVPCGSGRMAPYPR